MRKPIRQRIEELEQQKRTLQLRLDRQERAQTTRRKILLGSFILERLERNEDVSDRDGYDMQCDLKQWLKRALPAFLSRDDDRALFADLLGGCKRVQGQGATGHGAAKGTPNTAAQTVSEMMLGRSEVAENKGP